MAANPKRHSVITLNLYGIRRPELAVVFRDFLERMNETGHPNWELTVVEDVDSDVAQDCEDTLDAMLGNEHEDFGAFLEAEGIG